MLNFWNVIRRSPGRSTARVLWTWMGIAASCGSLHCGADTASSAIDAGASRDTESDDRTTGDDDGATLDASSGDDRARIDGSSSDIVVDNRDGNGPSDGRGLLDAAADNDIADGAGRDGLGGLDAAGDGSDAVDAAHATDAGGAFDAGGSDGAMRCNGFEALCDRRFDEVVFATTHNAMSNTDDGWVAPNQEHGMKQQLEDGIRGMLIDTYSYSGSTYLCHRSCILGNKLLVDGLRDMATFLRDHPYEVLTLIIEDHISAAETEIAFNASGLADFAYAHAAGSAWPTLRQMITSGRRLVVGAESGAPPPAWYHHFYDLAWDTPYTFRSAAEFSCAENRGKRENSLFLLNHWIENPLADPTLSAAANAHDLLLARARQCQMESGKVPNFVAVNHYAVGDLFGVVRELNGL